MRTSRRQYKRRTFYRNLSRAWARDSGFFMFSMMIVFISVLFALELYTR